MADEIADLTRKSGELTTYKSDPEFGQKSAEYVGLLRALGYGSPVHPRHMYGGGSSIYYGRAREPVPAMPTRLYGGGPSVYYGHAREAVPIKPASVYGGGLSVYSHDWRPGGIQDIRKPGEKIFRGSAPDKLISTAKDKLKRGLGIQRVIRTARRPEHFHRGPSRAVDAFMAGPTTIRIWTAAPKAHWAQPSAAYWWPKAEPATWSTDAWSSAYLIQALSRTYADIQASGATDERRRNAAEHIADLAASMLGYGSASTLEVGFEDEAPVLDVPVERRIRQARVIRLGRATPSLALSEEERRRAVEDIDA